MQNLPLMQSCIRAIFCPSANLALCNLDPFPQKQVSANGVPRAKCGPRACKSGSLNQKLLKVRLNILWFVIKSKNGPVITTTAASENSYFRNFFCGYQMPALTPNSSFILIIKLYFQTLCLSSLVFSFAG